MHPDNHLPFDSTHHSTTGARRGSYTESEDQQGDPSSRPRRRSQSRHDESSRRHRSQSRSRRHRSQSTSRRPRSHSRSRRGSGNGNGGSKRSNQGGSRRSTQRGSSRGGSSRRSSLGSPPRAGASPIIFDMEQPADPPLRQPTNNRGSLRVSTDAPPRRGSLSHIPRRFQSMENSGLSPSSSTFSSPVAPPTPMEEMMTTISISSTNDMGEA
eukprot:scaffold417699_cov47-Attheya_sp.AAC.1